MRRHGLSIENADAEGGTRLHIGQERAHQPICVNAHGVVRRVHLSGADTAWLSFVYKRISFGEDDEVFVEISDDGAGIDRARVLAKAEERGLDGPLVWAAGEGWHPGVVGIVAARLKEAANRPAVVIGIQKWYALRHQMHGSLVADNVLFYIALACMIIGSQLFIETAASVP